MTRKEAIEVLEIILDEYRDAEVFAPRLPALEMAIEALGKEPRKTAIETSKEELITNKRYRLTLSVWIERGEDAMELREQRRTVQYILSPNLFDVPKKYEKDVIMEMCEKIMELEGINQMPEPIRCKHCVHAEAYVDGSYYCRAMPIKDSFDYCSRARRKSNENKP